MGILRVAGAAAGAFLLLGAAAEADTRVALVIGNSAYQNVAHLPNPTNDAALIAAALKQDGFGVTLADDLDHDGLVKALRAFGKEADGADWAVIYYAGHGIEMAGTNYLVPVDAKLETDRDVGFEAVPLDQVESAIEGARTLRMVILDACRNDPFLAAMKRSGGAGRDVGRGLSIVEPEQATLVAYSAKAGTIAADGDGADSPFATALAQHLTEPGVEVDKLFRLVRDDVLDATGKNQEPFVYGSLPGRQNFYFRPPATAATPSPQELPHTIATEPNGNAEIVFWQSIQGSSRKTDFNAYLEKFPTGTFASLAHARLAALEPAPALKPEPSTTSTCDGGLVASVGNAGVAAAADRCLKPKDVFKDCEKCPEMVVIPAGTFTMGSPKNEKVRYDTEGPQHQVRLDAPFAVGKFQVTRGQFAAFIKDTGYKPADWCWIYANHKYAIASGHSFRDPGFKQDDSHPAVCISWDDAKAYVVWLTKTTGKSYRLLSEAEYEYAARAGTTTAYFFGDDPNQACGYANGADRTVKDQAWASPLADCGDGYVYTAPVGSFAANNFGLYDTVGNVWEWVEDCWHDSYADAPTDGSAWPAGRCKQRALRGGSWYSGPATLRSAVRQGDQPVMRGGNAGFRVARTLAP